MPASRVIESWHDQPADAVLAALETGLDGIAEADAASRRARFGANALPASPPQSALRRLLAQFDNLLIYVLLASAAVTALLGHAVDTAVILAVVVVNAVIGVVQEGKARSALNAIRGMISPKASVRRGGRRITVDAADVVPGDILLVEAGDRVTADIRLVKARNLEIDESMLTGESVPVAKSTAPVAADAAVGDRTCLAFSGTLVTAGQGAGVVVATGAATELGRISVLLGQVEPLETPLIRQMNIVARQLTFAVLALSAATFVFAVLVRGYRAADAFMATVGMAVAAIPEGLPAVMTITLAIGVQRMAARHAIIRHLPAVETLGAVTTICTDKTGTLTRNEMTVTRVVLSRRDVEVSGAGYAPRGRFSRDGVEIDPATDPLLLALCRAAVLCNDGALRAVEGRHVVDGDPMEGALIVLGAKAGFDRDRLARELPRLDEIPFDAAYRYMATLHRGHDGSVVACVKGAPEQILEMCSRQAADGGEIAVEMAYWTEAAARLGRQGRRVLAIAERPFPRDTGGLTFGDVDQGLTLLGFVGLVDPPRPEAVAAIAECATAGIAVKMISGDHAATASAIAAELGLSDPGRVLTGPELDRLGAGDLVRQVAVTSVFARASPEHKLRLVEAMQADGSIVAMTGDGVNDAPALKRAGVGVAMGRTGTEAAKEAAGMVLADDNFASIVAAVREGRTVYDNITKVIGWTLPTNGGETLIVVAAILAGVTLPMTPAQILWINMVTAVGLGLVLAFEPAEPGIMTRPPRRPDAPILSGALMWQVVLVSALFAIGAFGMFAFARWRGLPLDTARTMVVNTVVVMEICYLFSIRYAHGTSLTLAGLVGTPAVLIGVGGVTLLQVLFTYLPPLQSVFQTTSVGLVEGLAIIGVGAVLLLLLEAEKLLRRRVFGRRGRSPRDTAAEWS